MFSPRNVFTVLYFCVLYYAQMQKTRWVQLLSDSLNMSSNTRKE